MQQIGNQSLVSFMVSDQDRSIAVYNPATQELLGYAPVSTQEEIEQGIVRAHNAQKEWAKLTGKQRAAILQRWFRLLVENQDDLSRLMTLEQGLSLIHI